MSADPAGHGKSAFASRRSFLRQGLLAGSGCLASLHSYAQDSRFASESDIVSTTRGRVRGLRYSGGTQAFYGIPYGAPTGGSARFRKAGPVSEWRGILDATQAGNRCPQAPSGPNGPTVEVFSLDRKETMGEDCLSINVFTPATDNRQRPVMVWLHGGGYTSGSASWLLYDGSNLAQSQDVVVVTVNHRLNVYGFLYLEELGGEEYADSGNAGMLDTVAVLEWVRDNIGNFGGNPDNVTIFGQSGGGGKVSTLLKMPAAHGLFHKAIAMSGAAVTSIPAAAATETAERFLNTLNLDRSKLSRLQTLDSSALLAAYLGTPGLNLGPVVDGHNLPGDPFSPEAPAISADIPMLLGTTEHEANFFPATPLQDFDEAELQTRVRSATGADAGRADELIEIYRTGRPGRSNVELLQIMLSDNFRRRVLTQAERKSAQGAPVYLYYFTWQSPVRDGLLRAYHCLDIPFAFNNVDICAAMVGAGQERYRLASRMSTAFAGFARNGNPNHDDLPEWPVFDTEHRATMVINDNPELVNDPYGTELRALYM